MFMSDDTRKSMIERQIRDLNRLAEIGAAIEEPLRRQASEMKPGPEADAVGRSLAELTKEMNEIAALSKTLSKEQAARDAQSAGEADADTRSRRPAATKRIKIPDRGPPNG
jgi:hypothetical protein